MFSTPTRFRHPPPTPGGIQRICSKPMNGMGLRPFVRVREAAMGSHGGQCPLDLDVRRQATKRLNAGALPPSWLLLKDHWRAADSLRLESDCYLDAVGNPDEGNPAIHPVVLTVEGHCPSDVARSFPLGVND